MHTRRNTRASFDDGSLKQFSFQVYDNAGVNCGRALSVCVFMVISSNYYLVFLVGN